MTIDARRLLRQTLIVAAVALSWFGLFNLNAWLFSNLEHTARAHWIFLPAVLRPVSVLLFGGWGACGLVLGAYLTVYGTANGSYLHEIVLSLLSGLLPWLAVYLGKWALGIPESLAGLRAMHIVAICALCAGVNAIGLNGYLLLAGRLQNDPIQILTIFVGDLLGAAIPLFIISTTLAIALRQKAKTRATQVFPTRSGPDLR